ncbi:MAG: MarC family protein [Alphaproteobacteria bacterium]|nr:MarC family protein [Alphaproteobacteria bacterium]
MFSSFDLRQCASAFIVLFAIIDAVGALPLLVRLNNKGKEINPKRGAMLSLIMFLSFFYIGEAFLKLFGLDISTFAVAGSIVIFLIALEMILNTEFFKEGSEAEKDATFMPVVFPTLAGSGVLTTLLSIRAQYHDINILLALIANVFVIYGVLVASKRIEKVVSKSILIMIQKLFGVILLAIAIKIFTTNLTIVVEKLIRDFN